MGPAERFNTLMANLLLFLISQRLSNAQPAVSLHGRLLTIGEQDSDYKPTTAVMVAMHQPTTNSWEVISHMTIPKSICLAAVLPDNQLRVVGGWIVSSCKVYLESESILN